MTTSAEASHRYRDHPLGREFFGRATADVARDLLGAVIESRAGGVLTGGRIVETEAYLGSNDPGSHAATRGMTARNAAMYGEPGTLYVYFTYGNHHMLNVVTEPDGTAGAVLIRAIEPLNGIETMTRRRGGRPLAELANGPGKLAQALGLTLEHNRLLLGVGPVVLYHAQPVQDDAVETTGRVGLGAGHDLPLRFLVRGDPFVSRGRTGPRSAPVRNGKGGGPDEAGRDVPHVRRDRDGE